MVWVKPFVQGSSPSGRGGCASAVVGDMCLFIGGADRSPRAFSDVWVLKLGAGAGGASAGAGAGAGTLGTNSSRWVKKTTTVKGGARLPERTGATATAVGRKVYVFGGQEPTRGVCFNDVVVLDCNTWEWSRLDVSGASGHGVTLGSSPPPRNSHTACAANDGRLLVVYGGASQEDGPMGDVYVLDLQEGAERWTRPRVTGQSPEPREMHAACMLPKGEPAEEVAKGKSEAKAEEEAEACATSVTDGGGGDGDAGEAGVGWRGDHEMMVIGGRGRGGVLSDVVVLDVREMAWVRRGDVGRAICAHTAVPWVISTAAEGSSGGGGGSAEAAAADDVDDSKQTPARKVAGAALVFGGFTGAALHGSELVTVEGSTLTIEVMEATRGAAGGGKGGGRSAVTIPEPRFAHTAVALPRTQIHQGGAMLVFAGVTPAFDLNDLAIWVNEDPASPAPSALPPVPALPAAVPASDLD